MKYCIFLSLLLLTACKKDQPRNFDPGYLVGSWQETKTKISEYDGTPVPYIEETINSNLTPLNKYTFSADGKVTISDKLYSQNFEQIRVESWVVWNSNELFINGSTYYKIHINNGDSFTLMDSSLYFSPFRGTISQRNFERIK